MSRIPILSKSEFSSHAFGGREGWLTSLFQRKKNSHHTIQEKLLLVMGNCTQVVIFQMFLYWTGYLWDFDSFLHEERMRAETGTQELPPDSSGWMEKTSNDLYERLSLIMSWQEISQNLNALVSFGYLFRREDPVYPWEYKPQYRVNLVKLRKVLARYGYELEDDVFKKRRGLWINCKA